MHTLVQSVAACLENSSVAFLKSMARKFGLQNPATPSNSINIRRPIDRSFVGRAADRGTISDTARDIHFQRARAVSNSITRIPSVLALPARPARVRPFPPQNPPALGAVPRFRGSIGPAESIEPRPDCVRPITASTSTRMNTYVVTASPGMWLSTRARRRRSIRIMGRSIDIVAWLIRPSPPTHHTTTATRPSRRLVASERPASIESAAYHGFRPRRQIVLGRTSHDPHLGPAQAVLHQQGSLIPRIGDRAGYG